MLRRGRIQDGSGGKLPAPTVVIPAMPADPLSRRQREGSLADGRLHLLHRRQLRPDALQTQRQRFKVQVGVDEAGQDTASLQIHPPPAGPQQLAHFLTSPYCRDSIPPDRQRFCPWLARAHGVHDAVVQHQIGLHAFPFMRTRSPWWLPIA